MNKSTIILLLILTIVGCKEKTKLDINENQFQNKTFSLFSDSEKDTLVIEFQDSTHQIFGDLWRDKIPWRISHYENGNLLVLDDKVVGIKKTKNGYFDCTFIGLMDNNFILKERETKWNKELIYGTWIKKKDFEKLDYLMNDSISKPPLPPASEGLSEKDFKSPSYYEISKDSIKFYEYYSIHTSPIEMNNTNEYLMMKLGNEYHLKRIYQWNIKSLSNKEMIVENQVSELSVTKYKTDTLIRIKR